MASPPRWSVSASTLGKRPGAGGLAVEEPERWLAPGGTVLAVFDEP
jgi:hypothetical protein